MARRRSALLLLLAIACGCGEPPDVAPPHVSEVLSYVGQGRYALAAEPLASLTDFRSLTGAAARFRAGGFVRVSGEPESTEAAIRHAFRVQGSREVRLAYDVRDGVVRAHDYDSFAMLSLYRALERTRGFFVDAGLGEAELPAWPVYFRSRLEVFFFPLLASDNAAYAAPVDGFMFLNDFFEGAEVPLALNLGVVGHEYAHATFARLVFDGKLPPWATEQGWPDQTVNLVRALEEGIADAFGAILTGDPGFVGRSVEALADERDLAQPRVLTAADLRNTAEDALAFDPYALGSVIASALWEAGGRVRPEILARLLVQAQRELAGAVGRGFTLAVFLDRVVRAASGDPVTARAICAVFGDRLAAAGRLPCCGGTCR